MGLPFIHWQRCVPIGEGDAWRVGKCPLLIRCLDFDDQSVDRIFKETHELATWVVNQDELLDRKLLEARNIKVIRYVQSATHGRNLIISSDARESLLLNTLKEKLRALLASDTPADVIDQLLASGSWRRTLTRFLAASFSRRLVVRTIQTSYSGWYCRAI